MFPIPDSRGRIIAFGGRALSPDALAKYMNSPETELFHKGNVLYNFVRARKAIARGGTVIAVEGYMDVIALAQAGFENAVAPLGTALTENQLELLWRMTPRAGALLRRRRRRPEGRLASRRSRAAGDPAGPHRAFRASARRQGPRRSGHGPKGADAFRQVLADARPLADLLWMRETSGGVFDTPERKAELEKTLRD